MLSAGKGTRKSIKTYIFKLLHGYRAKKRDNYGSRDKLRRRWKESTQAYIIIKCFQCIWQSNHFLAFFHLWEPSPLFIWTWRVDNEGKFIYIVRSSSLPHITKRLLDGKTGMVALQTNLRDKILLQKARKRRKANKSMISWTFRFGYFLTRG